MNRYRVTALVDGELEVEREVDAMSVFGAVSLVTVDLWEDARAVTGLTACLIAESWPRSEH